MSSYYALLPPLIAILGAGLTKRIIPSLFAGLLAGTMLKSGALVGTFMVAGRYLARAVASEDHAYIILFLFCFGALAEMFKVGGGISGFAKGAESYVKSERGALLSVWAVTPLTFLDCCFHVISTGTIANPLLDKVKGSKEKLAFVINTTSSQLIVLIPFATTYVGYLLGVISTSMADVGLKGNPYAFYLAGVYLNFYSITMLVLSVGAIFINFDFLKMLQPAYKKVAKDGDHDEHHAHEECEFAESVPPRVSNLIIPLVVLLALIVYLFWYTGRAGTGSFWAAFMNADFELAIFVATIATVVVTTVLYSLQKVPMRELQSHFLAGGTEMLPPIVVLVLAWSITQVTQDLGFGAFAEGVVGTTVAPQIVPVLAFAISGLASYFMGSSWGAWALVMPIGMTLAVTAGAHLPLSIGAVLAGGSIGDNISPLGETPVLTAAVTEVPLSRHVNYILPYGIVAIIISLLLYLVLGYSLR